MMLSGLDRFGLTPSALLRLRGRRVRIRVNLRSFEVTSRVARLAPSDRHSYLSQQAGRWVSRLFARYPDAGWSVEAARGIALELEGSVAANRAESVASQPGVRSVVICKVPGYRMVRTPARSLEWYCVRARVAIQVENEHRGLQTIEDRFMLVRAASFEDAERRLAKQWREYATPYLNPKGHLVRWKMERVTDIYEVGSDELDPNGVEVYSKLAGRRMRPEFVWSRSRKGRLTTA
jgi:hypothetical protein